MRRPPLALTVAVAVALAGGAAAQSDPGRQPTPDHLRVLQEQTREFERRFRTPFPHRAGTTRSGAPIWKGRSGTRRNRTVAGGLCRGAPRLGATDAGAAESAAHPASSHSSRCPRRRAV